MQPPVLCLLGILLQVYSVEGFQCQSCVYSWTREHPDSDTACVFQPGVFTGWQVLPCENYCVVQETYNTVLQKVVGYWRSCTDKPTADVCQGQEILTCVYTCQGDFCNSWVRGQLHELFHGANRASSLRLLELSALTFVCLVITCWWYSMPR